MHEEKYINVKEDVSFIHSFLHTKKLDLTGPYRRLMIIVQKVVCKTTFK